MAFADTQGRKPSRQSAIGNRQSAGSRRQAAGGRRWRWRVFRRSPVNLVRPTLLVSTTRRIFGRAQNILHDKSATVRKPDRHTAWTSRRHGCGLRCRRSKPGGTATRHRSHHHQRKGSRVWECDSLCCRIFDPYECFDGAHASLPIRQPRCRCVRDTVRRCLQGGGRMADEVSHRVFMTGDGKRAVWERIRREARRCVSVVTNGELPGAAFRIPGTGGRA